MNFQTVLDKYRKFSFSEKDKGERFERLMKAYLLTDRKFESKLKKVWLWSEFPGKDDLGGWDVGIDLVGLTIEGDYWAIQCKCYAENASMDKPSVDSFLSTSSRKFKGEDLKTTGFAHRLWISTTNNWGRNAVEAIQNQYPPVSRIGLTDLIEAKVDWEKLEKDILGTMGKSVAEIAQRQTVRITKLISEDAKHQAAFDNFLKGLHKNINPSISQPEAIEMLSQHIITKPVFDALFEGYSFVKSNPMSQSMQKMLDLLEEQSLEKDAEILQRFYDSVKTRASGIDNAEGKQRIIIELYDKFFKTAFPKMVEKLGIVYTPGGSGGFHYS
ncbi:MAG TPA: hypothetical protein PL009_03425 [Flavipsychrobacter sp.]|nr:hypothetical protein [Flavipsychrobacter sp.]